ncbi:hypothetical protein AB6G31_21195 [Providencia hangzhouensis]|uniref:hypothetical protein n=1 Tax=Providencia hangzhouensis TaxID=3031799 RepID=UPI0034DD0499
MIDDFVDDIFSDPFFVQDVVFSRPDEAQYLFGWFGDNTSRGFSTGQLDSEPPETIAPLGDLNYYTLSCIVQPASNDELQLLPEGIRYNPVIRLMSQEPVKGLDLFLWKGYRYQIIQLSNWSDYGYYDTFAVRYEGAQTSDSDGFKIT